MAFVTFRRTIEFDISALRTLLNQHLPLFRWQCGEHDTGEPGQIVPFDRPQLIVGRTSSALVFVELRPHVGQLAGPVPAHSWHLEIGEPTTEHRQLALRVQLVAAGSAMTADEEAAYCRLRPDGNWLSAADVFRALELLGEGADAAIDALGTPPTRFGGIPEPDNVLPGEAREDAAPPAPPLQPEPAPPPPAQPVFGRRVGGFGRKGL